MKQIVILTIVILISGILLADDPNRMPEPTAQESAAPESEPTASTPESEPTVSTPEPTAPVPLPASVDPDIIIPAAVNTDPNFMIPVVVSVDPDSRIVTVSFYMVNVDRNRRSAKYEPVKDADIWSWANDTDFLATFQSVYRAFPHSVREKIAVMTRTATWEDGRKVYDRAREERTNK